MSFPRLYVLARVLLDIVLLPFQIVWFLVRRRRIRAEIEGMLRDRGGAGGEAR